MTDSIAPDPRTAPPREEAKRELKEFAKMILWFLAVFLVLKSFVIEGYEVQGDSMAPALASGDRILVVKLPVKMGNWFGGFLPVDFGDVIVFDSPEEAGKRYVKRVIAAGDPIHGGNTAAASVGDKQRMVSVRIAEGRVFVNNHRLLETYLPEGAMPASEYDQEVALSAGEFYVMGDNRDVSKDSRSFHAIGQSTIVGRAVLRFWPLSKFGLVE